MPFTADVSGALRQLAATKNRFLELIEWEKLAIQEQRKDVPPAFDPHTSLRRGLRDDARNLNNMFISLASDIDDVLRRYDLACTQDERTRWRLRLEKLERDMAQQAATENLLSF